MPLSISRLMAGSRRFAPRWEELCHWSPMVEANENARVLPFRPKFGQGREEMPDGSIYVGNFRYSLREGQGQLLLDQQGTDLYEGHFRAGHFDGRGVRRWADGTIYDGQWRAGRKHGEGTLCEPNGRVYRGQWRDGKRHGFGVQQLDGAVQYEGRWENGLQHGSGKVIDTRNDSVFQGQWICGAHHGQGLLRSKGGVREKMRYNHGMLVAMEELPQPQVRPPVPKAAHTM